MRAFLTYSDRPQFLTLYPDWAGRYRSYDAFVNNVVQQIYHSLRQRALNSASREPARRSATSKVAGALLDHITKYERLAAFNKATEDIVRDYVVNPAYADLYLAALKATAAAKVSAWSKTT